VLRPLVDEFFDWVRAQNDLSCQARGVVNKALGYAVRQQLALRRCLDDARLLMDNNHSENALRVVASGYVRHGCSSAPMTTPMLLPISTRSLLAASCMASTPSATSPK
jgi:hypothetical protein